MNVVFKNRDFSSILSSPSLQYKVVRYSHSVMGGPKLAEIAVSGNEIELWELMEYVRRPVTIISDKGDAVWWGWVAEVRLDIGQWSVGINIDSMANYVGVAYEDDEDSDQPKITDWAEATDSTFEYGRREILITSSGSNATHATAARDKYLAEKKYPIPVISQREKGENVATLICRGWFDTLSWKYAPIPVNFAYGNLAIGTRFVICNIGTSYVQEVAQSFWISADCNVVTVSVYVKKIGSPTDNLEVSLYSVGSDGYPDTELASANIAGSLLTTDYAWYDVALVEALTGPNTYFIKLSRSGSPDNTDYFNVNLNDDYAYPYGNIYFLDDTTWYEEEGCDMPFKIYQNESVETTQQIATLAANYGQFLTAFVLDNQSGLFTKSARDGNANAYYEITELMKMGTVNYRRLLAKIDEYRRMIVYEEPAATSLPYLIVKDGSLRDPYNTPVRKDTCPVGIWARFKEIIPSSVDVTKLADPSMMFVDEAEYIVNGDLLNLVPRGYIDPFQIGRPRDG